ncbi:MAG TPA: phage integrase N-terminal SAM-like domain-containing protein [Opitutaceae bacterium]
MAKISSFLVDHSFQRFLPMKSRNDVVAMVRDKVRLKHYALATEYAYCAWIRRYYDFCSSLHRKMSHENKAEAFLTHLAVAGQVSAKTQNKALSALLFLYRDVLDEPLGGIAALRARRPGHERTAPSRDEIKAFRSAVVDSEHTPARLLVDLLYGCGLRVGEPLEFRVKDVLWDERQLIIRAAKGGKDRRVPVPSACLVPLRAQVAKARIIWERDRANSPSVGVSLPFQLKKKYPSAALAWLWFWGSFLRRAIASIQGLENPSGIICSTILCNAQFAKRR